MARKALSKWFAKGSGYVSRYPGSETLLFQWNGRADGSARLIRHVGRYSRNGTEYPSLSALLRAVEAEHQEKRP